MVKVLRYLLRKFYFLLALALISMAVLVQLGRSIFPMVGDYREHLATYLSEELNAQVSIGGLSAEWEGLRPVLEIQQLGIVSQTDQPLLQIDEARLRLDLLRSLINWRPVWRNLRIGGTRLEFVQAADGFWSLRGLARQSTRAPEMADFDVLVDMLLLANRTEFSRTQLTFSFANEHQVELVASQLLLENRQDFHRLTLDVDAETHRQAVQLLIEGTGDPRDLERFRANGYLRLQDFPTSEPLAAVMALLLGEAKERQLRGEGLLNTQLWFNTRNRGEGVNITGELSLQTLYLPLFEQEYRLDSFTAHINGYWRYLGGWQLTLPGISAALGEAQVSHVNLAIRADNPGEPLEFQLDRLDLGKLYQIVDKAGFLGEGRLREVMSDLQPRGLLQDLHLTLPVKNPRDWQLSARAEQLAVSAWRGVPALSGVDGYVSANQRGGYINLDVRSGFSAHFDPTYARPMEFQQASGQVAWHLQPENNRIYVNSGLLELRQNIDEDDSASEEVRGYFWLSLPWHSSGDMDLYLHVGSRQLASRLYPKYVPAVLPDALESWLKQALGETAEGQVSDAGFVFRGTLNTSNPLARSHQLYLKVADAALDYHPDWPALRQLQGRLLVDDNQVRADVWAGKAFDSQIREARVRVDGDPDRGGAPRPFLEIEGKVTGPAGDGLRLLRETYLRRLVGDKMDTWRLDGQYAADLALGVGLGGVNSANYQSVSVELEAEQMSLPNFQVSADEIRGVITYSHEAGLGSRDLQGLVFGEPTAIAFETLRPEGQEAFTRIALEGKAPIEALAGWTQRPELLFLKGKLGHQTRIDLPHRQDSASDAKEPENPLIASVSVHSDLAETSVSLPAPFGKSAQQTADLSFVLDIYERSQRMRLDYRQAEDARQPLLQVALEQSRDDQSLTNANVALGTRARLPAEPQFLLSGELPVLQLDEWRKVSEAYVTYVRRLNPDSGGDSSLEDPLQTGRVAGLPLRLDITLASHVLGPLKLENLNLTAWQEEDHWHLSFANPRLVGNLQKPLAENRPMTITLQELHLTRQLLGDSSAQPADTEEDGAISLLEQGQEFHPRDLPRANVQLQALYVDEHNYGSWSLEVHPDSHGALFDNIRGQIRGLTVDGIKPADGSVASARGGASLYWMYDDVGPRTRFTGSLTAGDMADVMRAWEKPDMLDSRRAEFQVDLIWPGAPGEFALAALEGEVDLVLTDGSFKRGAGAGEGILRLLSLVNFDTLARRLRLDFSDLYKSGLAYDQVKGRVEFRDGHLYLADPLQVQGPSSRMQLAGIINLRDETIDARLIATLPVAGNLTFLAALATGLPAAAGIYLVSKLFRKQVDQATSVSYRIQGDWDKPVMRFDRLFESEASLRSSVSGRRNKTEDQKNRKTE
jgi:uncharacterized protein (TIGR02099 family)